MSISEKRNADPLQLLSIFGSGTLTVGVNGFPFLKVDAKAKSVDVEVTGIKECGISLSSIMELEGGKKGVGRMLKNSESAAKGLNERGWSLVLYDKGSKILRMGRGVSRLTGYIHVNPLKIRKILKGI